MTTLYVQSPTLYLSGSGIVIGATSATLSSFTDIYGNVLTMADFGALGYITFEPDTTNAEGGTFTGVTANANGTYTLTGLKTILAKSPYTQTSGSVRNHAGGTKVVVTDNVGFWARFANKDNDETILGRWGSAVAPSAGNDYVNKTYADGLVLAAAVPASTTTVGYVKMSTNPVSAVSPVALGENDTRVPSATQVLAAVGNNTDIAVGTGNKFVTQTGLQHNAEKYAADAGANDTYVVTLSPVPTSYTNGMVVYFKANTINTGAATLNVNSLGAKTIVKGVSTTLADGDILAGQFCTVIYDGTNFVLQNPVKTNSYQVAVTRLANASTQGNLTENTVFTTTINANSMGATGDIHFKLPIEVNTSPLTNSTDAVVMRLKFGGTTYSTITITSPNTNAQTSVSNSAGFIEGYIVNSATNTQNVSFFVTLATMANNTLYYASFTSPVQTTSAIDTTANQTLALTNQRSSTSQGGITFGQTVVTVINQ